MRAALAILIAAAWLGLLPTAAAAQTPTLHVRLVDQRGAGVPRVTISLRDAGGTQDLGAQATDARGEASFTSVNATTVRLTLRGILPSGAAIALGETSFRDEAAILVRTDIGGPLVALIMDTAGQVYLDPSALALEGGPVATLTATTATTRPAAAIVPTLAAPPAPLPAALPGWVIILIGLLLTGVAFIFSVARKARP